jgi:undecaprenyl-diphosphatase
MPLLQVVILAIVQGITEFLPISSSAHLALAPWLLGWKDQGLTFDIALHFGTLLAVLAYFFRDWVQIIAQGFGFRWGHEEQLTRNRGLLWFLALATIPVGVFGFLYKDLAETAWRSPMQIGVMLILIGLLMLLAERVSSRKRDLSGVNLVDALVIGAAQALAIVPGTSRSGITITAGLFRNLNRESAARFSFLLSTPAVGGAALKALKDLIDQGGIPPDMRMPFIVGIIVSALTGAVVIAWFLRYLQRHTLRFFVAYRIVFGIIVIALAALFRPAE